MKVYTIGGFNEVGKNMTVLDFGEDAIILDCGLYLPAVVELQEQEQEQKAYSEKRLRSIGAIPDDTILDKFGIRSKVRAILIGHAHLDHVGAIPYVAHRYNAPVLGTPFTIEVLKRILEDENIPLKNELKTVNPNGFFEVKGKNRSYKVEFLNITHSTIQTALIAIHTPEGVVLYANDFKIDDNPILGLPPNYDALKRIAKEGVKLLVVDSLYSGSERKTPSEKVARALLEEVMLTTKNENSAIFVATFSSHIARLKSIVDFSKKLNREVFFVGRSLSKYVNSAKRVKLCPFENDVRIGTYKKQVASMLKKVEKNREKSVVVCTGHQGEPGSILDRLAKGVFPFQFRKNDNVIFASKTIPVPVNISNKENIDKRLKKAGARIFDEVHVSGHAGREDLRDFIEMLTPQNIIPSHGSTQQLIPMLELCRELGYRMDKETHLMHDGQTLEI